MPFHWLGRPHGIKILFDLCVTLPIDTLHAAFISIRVGLGEPLSKLSRNISYLNELITELINVMEAHHIFLSVTHSELSKV